MPVALAPDNDNCVSILVSSINSIISFSPYILICVLYDVHVWPVYSIYGYREARSIAEKNAVVMPHNKENPDAGYVISSVFTTKSRSNWRCASRESLQPFSLVFRHLIDDSRSRSELHHCERKKCSEMTPEKVYREDAEASRIKFGRSRNKHCRVCLLLAAVLVATAALFALLGLVAGLGIVRSQDDQADGCSVNPTGDTEPVVSGNRTS